MSRELLRLLKGYNASINLAESVSKWTPLFFATLCGRHESVGVLLDMGADKEMCDARGMTCVEMIEKEIANIKIRLSPVAGGGGVLRGMDGFSPPANVTSAVSTNMGVTSSSSLVNYFYYEDLQSIVSIRLLFLLLA